MRLLLIFLIFSSFVFGQKTYVKNPSKNGKLHYEGQLETNQKIAFWNFYDDNEKINHKCQLSNNKNSYYLMYKNEKLSSALKYFKGEKNKEWTDLKAFKKENKLSDLKN